MKRIILVRRMKFPQSFQPAIDVKTVEEILRAECPSLSPRAAATAPRMHEALHRLSTEWPYPSRRTFKETGIVRTLKQCLKVISKSEETEGFTDICQMMETQHRPEKTFFKYGIYLPCYFQSTRRIPAARCDGWYSEAAIHLSLPSHQLSSAVRLSHGPAENGRFLFLSPLRFHVRIIPSIA
jgi:hypothetical protein